MATVTITLDDGTVLTGAVQLSNSLATSSALDSPPLKAKETAHVQPTDQLDFSIPLRPFMNDYAEGLSGSKKFALLVAHFAKGEVDVAVDRAEVVEAWNKMTGLMGGKFNGAHEARSKDSGFVYVPASGKIALLKKWRQVLS